MTRSKAGALLISFLIAFGLWMYVITYVSTDHEQTFYNLDVALSGESMLAERGLMILGSKEFQVDVTVSGSRQNVSKVNAGNLQLVVDLSEIYDPGIHTLTCRVNYPGDIPTGTLSSRKNPDRVTVEVARRRTKEVPIRVSYQGDVPAGYIKDTAAMELDRQTVQISGPAEVVDRIDHAAITVNCEGRTETIYESFRYELRDVNSRPVDAAYITTNVEQVRVHLPVVMVKKLPLTVTVVDGGGATSKTSKIVIDPVELTVSGSESALAALTEVNIATIDLAQITADTELTFDIVLPDGIGNVSNLPTATVKISFPQLAIREFTVTTFTPLNLAEGMTWECLTKQLTITVRGPKSEVQRLTEADIQVRVDLSGVENTSAVEPVIEFAKSYEALGVVGSYTVSVQVMPQTIPEE